MRNFLAHRDWDAIIDRAIGGSIGGFVGGVSGGIVLYFIIRKAIGG